MDGVDIVDSGRSGGFKFKWEGDDAGSGDLADYGVGGGRDGVNYGVL